MRKMSKKEKAARYDELNRQHDALTHFVQITANHVNPDVADTLQFEREGDSTVSYEFKLYDVRKPHGGVLTVLECTPGERIRASVFYFDDWYAKFNQVSEMWRLDDFARKMRIVANDLLAGRERVLSQKGAR